MTEEINPQDEIELLEKSLREQREALEAQMKSIQDQQNKLNQLRELRELEKPVTIRIISVYDSRAYFKHDFRKDVNQVFVSYPKRQYNGTCNVLPNSDVKDAIEKLQKLPNVIVEWDPQALEAFKLDVETPAYLIKLLGGKELAVYVKQGYDSWAISKLPGVKWQQTRNPRFWSVPLTEGWRLPEALEPQIAANLVVFEQEAQDYILDAIHKRATLDTVAKLEDTEYDPCFQNGVQLRPFQRVGAYFVECAGHRAMISDQPGLGKTWQALAYAHKNNLRTVIVCPASLKTNWAREVKRLTGENPVIMSGGAPTEYDIINQIAEQPRYTILNYDILAKKIDMKNVTTDKEGFKHEEVRERWLWAELILLAKPDLIIFDEAHYLQNYDSLRSRASRLMAALPRVLLLTATPLINRPGNLWPLLHIIDPDSFSAYETFVNRYTIDGKVARNAEELREILKLRMIRRMRQDVMKQLPKVQPIPEYHALSPKAKKLYDRVLEGVFNVIAEWNPDEAGSQKEVTNILTQIMRLKQICSYDKVERTADLATELYDGSEGAKHRKVIIFSQFVSAVHSIARRLGQEAIVITGELKPEDRQKLVDVFQNNPSIHFAVCSTKAVSEGLTMTAAGSVINHDLMWTAAAHEQAEGRAYGRLNDAHAIDSYYMIAEDTIEEKILELINYKRALSEQLIDGTNDARDASVAMDLIRYLKESLWKK